MPKTNFTKIKLLKLWEILSRDSDEDHPLSTSEIIDKLKHQGVECDRKTLYEDIRTLNEYGYEVLCEKGQHSNLYCVVDRSFDVPELHILMDAVQAAGFITEKKTAELIDKIASLGGSNRAELLKTNLVHFNTTKHSNENIYYNVYAIGEAILSGKKLSFLYFDYDEKGERVFRKDGCKYIVNPVATVFSNDNYYLLCYHDKHDNAASYRVDRMTEVKVESEDINKAKRPKNLDVSTHRKQAFSMYAGETVRVRLQAEKSLIDVLMDKFGEELRLISYGDCVQFETDVQISPNFFGWCLSFGKKLKIISPNSLREQLHNYIQDIETEYQ